MNKIIIGLLVIIIAGGGYMTYQSKLNFDNRVNKVDGDNTSDVFTKKYNNPKVALVALDGSNLATQLKKDGSSKIGCDDVIAYKNIDGNLNAKQILEKMFNFSDYKESNGFYNVFQFSKNLKVKNINLNKDGVININLTGDLITSGICDVPRVSAQILETVKLFDSSIKDVEIYINGEDINSFLSEKDDVMDEEIKDKKKEKPKYNALIDDPFVYKEPPVNSSNSFILTHNGVMWEDICVDNLGDKNTQGELIKHLKENILDDEWSFIEFKATEANIAQVAFCPAKYDVSCVSEDKGIEFSLHFDSGDKNQNDTIVKNVEGDLKYRINFSPIAYNTLDEKKLIQASCFLQGNKVQGIEKRVDAEGEWK